MTTPPLIREAMALLDHGIATRGQLGSAVLVDIDPQHWGGVMIASPTVVEDAEVVTVIVQAALVVARELGQGDLAMAFGGAIPSKDPADVFEERPLMNAMLFIASADRPTRAWVRGMRQDDSGRFSWWGEWNGPVYPQELLHQSQERLIHILERAVSTPFHVVTRQNARQAAEVLGFHIFVYEREDT